MNITRSLSLIVASVFSSHGEMFISATNQVNSLTISSNEALLISAAKQSITPDGHDFRAYITIAGVDLPFSFNDRRVGTLAIAGSAELKFHLNTTNLAPVLISFERVQGSAIHSLYVTNSTAQPPPTIPTIVVPAGRTCHFFPPIGGSGADAFVTVISGTDTVPSLYLLGGEEFAGPVSLQFSYRNQFSQDEPDGAIISYYFNEDSILLPEMKLVAGPTGSFGITVEKSTDLTHWHPVAVQTTSSDRQAYYRLRITR
jgi:hypothetical protein